MQLNIPFLHNVLELLTGIDFYLNVLHEGDTKIFEMEVEFEQPRIAIVLKHQPFKLTLWNRTVFKRKEGFPENICVLLFQFGTVESLNQDALAG